VALYQWCNHPGTGSASSTRKTIKKSKNCHLFNFEFRYFNGLRNHFRKFNFFPNRQTYPKVLTQTAYIIRDGMFVNCHSPVGRSLQKKIQSLTKAFSVGYFFKSIGYANYNVTGSGNPTRVLKNFTTVIFFYRNSYGMIL